MRSIISNLKSRVIIFIVLLICFSSLAAYAEGVRFDAQQATFSSNYVGEGSVLIGEEEIGSYKIFFFENDDKYRTVIAEKVYVIWKLYNESFWAHKTDDIVKLVGWCSINSSENREGITAIPVQSYDKQVAYVDMGPIYNRISKDVTYGETVISAWGEAIRWNDLNAVAYSSNGKPLYKLGYEIVNNHINTDELRWLPLE